MADGFLGRWSRRKLDAKEGRPLEPEPPRPVQPEPPEAAAVPASPAALAGEAAAPDVVPAQPAPPPPPPTLEDVQALTTESDFTRFVRPDVPAEVKNAAVKKLFSDPHFNVMDRLDVYIDDYGKPDPIPESMLKQLAASKFLGLFREEERKDEAAAEPRDDAEGQAAQSVAQSQPPADPAPAPSPAVPLDSHDHPDLRLQQDDAAGRGEAGRSTG